MLNFSSDYTQGCHPKILEALAETNFDGQTGYGFDCYTQSAINKIKLAINCPNAQVALLTGGTQTNQIVIDSLLKSYQGVVAATTGHVAVHESGAIEFGGHKVITLPSHNGKMESSELAELIADFYADESFEHMVFPGMVYISHPTEYGTLYSLAELNSIKAVCGQYNIPLYVDGARLGYGLMSPNTDVTIQQLAAIADVFYIGGTKVGALCGEAVVFSNIPMPKHFLSIVKQHGALLAKGRLNGVQFDTLFTDDLYFKISQNAIDRAMQLKQGLAREGFRFYIDSPTNQQFIIVPTACLDALSQKVGYSRWCRYDECSTVIRLCTSWATTPQQIDELILALLQSIN